jgi:vancomycin resistance protein YoaR
VRRYDRAVRFSPVTAAFVLGGLISGAALAAVPSLTSWVTPGVEVELEGHPVPGDQALEPWLEGRKGWLGRREAYLALPETLYPVSFAELGLGIDVAETKHRVERALGPRPTFFAGLGRAFASRQNPPIEATYVWSFDRARAERALTELAALVHREPVDARLDLEAHRRIVDRPGRELDVERTLIALQRGSRQDQAVFALATREIPAAVTSDMIAAIDVSKILASYETDFEHKAGPRAVNIAVAAGYLNGTVLGPGEKLSFNRVVGERSFERGFVDAPVIVEDVMEKGVGGGVCQVASTLHAAAVFAGLEVVQRRSHSRPSGYAPLGLDAVVIDGEVDLKIRNPYPVPVMIHAFLPSKYRIRVEFLGLDPPAKVDHSYVVEQSYDFYRRVITKSDFRAGRIKRHQKGIRGYDVVSVVRARYPDGRSSVRRYPSKYYPVPEVYYVAADADLGKLPELPEGATHVEYDAAAAGESRPGSR